MEYIKRLADKTLTGRLKTAGAVLIRGPKACGKTWTANEQQKSRIDIDTDASVPNLIAFEPTKLLEGEAPRLIDEWQEQPVLWNLIRREVDNRGKSGQFILTGSANPVVDAKLHSGVGRFSIMTMRTMSWAELGWSSGNISLGGLLAGEAIKSDTLKVTYDDIINRIIVGGWPKNLNRSVDEARQANVDYYDLLADADMARATGKVRDPNRVRAVLKSLARNVSTNAEVATIMSDAKMSVDLLGRTTVDDYLDTLERLMILVNQPAFNPHIRSTAELRKTPKRHLADASLAVAALNLDYDKLFADPNYLGFLFESTAIHDLLVYADANDAKVSFYRDSYGNEIDAIVEMRSGEWAAFEVKLGNDKYDEAAGNLLKLAENIDEAKTPKPKSLNIITGVGLSYTRPDGVNVISLSSLGA